MSTERTPEVTSGGVPEPSLEAMQEKDPEELKRIRAEKKARLVRILARGFTHDKLHVDLPEHLYGEWIPNDPISILEAESIGFAVDTTYATKQRRGMHDHGDGRAVLGDCVYMVMLKEDKEIHDEIRREAFELANGKPGDIKATQTEERGFAEQSRGSGLPIVQESRSRQARKAELEAALRANAGADPGVTSTGSPAISQVT